MTIQFQILRSSFSKRIFLVFLICVILPMVLVFSYTYHHVGEALDAQNFEQLHRQVRSTSLSIYARLLFLRGELNLLVSRFKTGTLDSVDFSKYTKRFFESQDYKQFTAILIRRGDQDIVVYGKSEPLRQLSRMEISMIDQGKTVLMQQHQRHGYPSIFMVVPISGISGGKEVLIGKISTEYLWGIGPMNSLPPMTDLFVIGEDHQFLIASVHNPDGLIKRLANRNFQDSTRKINLQYNGENHIAAWCSLFLEGQFSVPHWTILMSRSQKSIRTSLEGFKILFPVFSLLSLLVVLLISSVAVRHSLQPLQKLKKATRILASGNFNAKAEISSGDEFEELADAFNQMGVQLQSQFEKLKLTAEIGQHIASTIEARELVDKVLASICRHLDFSACFLAWRAHDSEGAMGTGSFRLSSEQEQILFQEWRSSEGAGDSLSLSRLGENAACLGEPHLASRICIPLRFADQLTGVLLLFKKRSEAIPRNLEEILSGISDELSVSLANILSLNRFLESEARFRNVFENSAAGIALLDAQGRFIKVNPSLCRMLGYREKEILEINPAKLLSPESRHAVFRLFQDLRDGKSDSGFLEESYIHKDGYQVWGMVSHSLMRDRTGHPMYFINLIQDISELKKMRSEKEILENQLQQAQKMQAIGTLAGGIAHDFNNILMAIIGYTELVLMDMEGTDSSRSMLDQSLKAAYRASDLVKQILTFSRQSLQEKRPISLTPLVKEVLKLIRATIPAGMRIEEDLKDHMKKVMADPTQIHQILMNLCTNAYHAMLEKGVGVLRVEIKVEKSLPDRPMQAALDLKRNGEWLKISMSDTGCGIPPENLPRIFEPYFTTKASGKGTGLGLSVVHGIIMKSGGCIDVRSREGEGTTFDLFLPVCSGEDELKASENAYAVIGSGKEKIMVVDDEEPLAIVVKKMLEKLGYRVRTFTNPEKAIEAFRDHPYLYDLVITDKDMPQMSGQDFAAAVQAIAPGLPVLIASGFHGDDSADGEKYTRGRPRYIQKPLGFSDLRKAVRAILDSPSVPGSRPKV